MGLADADRLGLMGHSYGGYGTYALIALTHRFRAAVALGRDRRPREPVRAVRRAASLPARRARISTAEPRRDRPASHGRPAWQDPERYVRNSPLFTAGEVQTPLLIIRGDMDYVPTQQESSSSAPWYRQGKRARFVRYWGEGHVLQSPANVHDMWQQIFRWFVEFLS